MTDLNRFQADIVNLAKRKGWKDDLAWLGLGCFKEVGELWTAIEKYKMSLTTLNGLPEHEQGEYLRRIVKPLYDELGGEFSGVMHYLLQIMYKTAPDINLDDALTLEIEKNSVTKKKTYENGEIVRK
jgi:NTP pyrophosphatase (non-canonical NTP hydrolase)